MFRGVRSYLVGSLVLLSLAGCGRFWFAEREPWRREAEIACLKSGAVRESVSVVQTAPISGPGVCGADFPLKVAALGESMALGFADAMRPPGAIPVSQERLPQLMREQASTAAAPLVLGPPAGAGATLAPLAPSRNGERRLARPAEIAPPATLACPIVSALDSWLAQDVQPAAMRWFGQPVAELKQISAYSCRGMNGQRGAKISEHAFGNALDIAAFTLADGRRITIREGWRGPPEEQGFLRDVQAGACRRFSTVLGPGSNAFHYDHLHVDLMRRASGQAICNPEPVAGEVVAARAMQRTSARGRALPAGARRDIDDPFAYRPERDVTGAIGRRLHPATPGED